jgi:phage-related protein
MSKTTLTHRSSTNIFSSIEKVIKGIANGIKSFFMSIVNGIVALIKGVFNGVKWVITTIINGITWVITTIIKGIVSFFKWIFHILWLVFVKPFLPTHRVVFSLYTVIPGLPVNNNESVHMFEKGTTKKAIKFYNDAVRSTTEKKIVPAEIKLYKRKKMVASKNFGPVDEIKKFNIVSKKVKV